MPISVADIFRPQPLDGTQLILGGAQNVLQSAIGASIQTGRDIANLRASQEREFLAERDRQVQLDQRRAENLQTQYNTDRTFSENVARDRRDFGFTVAKDQRDFNYQKSIDAQKIALESLRVGTTLDLQGQELKLKQKQIDLLKEKQDAAAKAAENKTLASKEFLNSRASSILDMAAPKGFLQRVFGGATDPAPKSLLELGTELTGVAKLLGDPNLAAKADELKLRGQKQLDVIASQKKGKTTGKAEIPLADKITKLERQIQAWTTTENDLGKLPAAEQQKKNLAILELEALKKKLGDQNPNAQQDPVDLARKYLDSVRK